MLSDATVKCWGYNHEGQLGYGNREYIGDDELPSSVGPVSITTNPTSTVASVTAGGEHTCARLRDGAVKCWGASYDGQLGYGNKEYIGDDELPLSVGPLVLF